MAAVALLAASAARAAEDDGLCRNGVFPQEQGQFGLAKVDIRDDPTLRKGDLVAGADGLLVAGKGRDKRGASLKLSPVPASDSNPSPVVASN